MNVDRLTTIFFDVGGTLIHPDLRRLMAPLLVHAQPTPAQLIVAERAAKRNQRWDGGDVPPSQRGDLGGHAGPVNWGYWQLYFTALLDELGYGYDLLPELTARAGDSSYWTLVDSDAVPTLTRLQSEYRLAVISNADGHIDRVLQHAGLTGFFKKVIDSGLAGYEKPDPRIFQAALQRMGARPERSLYVGDIYAIDARGATLAGMHSLLLDPNGVYDGWDVARIAALSELPQWLQRQRGTMQGFP
jgi:HAD superfamily hydrolase (TIGR01509 family)